MNIHEELTKSDVKDSIKSYIGTREFEKRINDICNDKIDDFLKTLWQRKSFWKH